LCLINNGDVEFIANGSNELILTSGEIPNCDDSKTFQLLDDFVYNNEKEIDQIKLYPNPFTKVFTILFEQKNQKEYLIDITDIQGRIILKLMKNTYIGLNVLSVNMEKFEKGIYFAKIFNNNDVQTFKIIKQ